MHKDQNRVPASLSRKGYARLIGYTAWITAYAAAVLWLGPENRTTWIGASFAALIAFVVITVPTFMQARNEKSRNDRLRYEPDVLTIMEPRVPVMQFHDPREKDMDMHAWLVNQP